MKVWNVLSSYQIIILTLHCNYLLPEQTLQPNNIIYGQFPTLDVKLQVWYTCTVKFLV